MDKNVVKILSMALSAALLTLSSAPPVYAGPSSSSSGKSIQLFDHFGMHEEQYKVHLLQDEQEKYEEDSAKWKELEQKIEQGWKEVDRQSTLYLYPEDDHSWEGVSYDKATNTITFDNFGRFNTWVELSGEEPVNIVLKGSSKIGCIKASGTPVNITGSGTLIINPAVTGTYHDGYGEITYNNEYMSESAINSTISGKKKAVTIGKDATVVCNSAMMNANSPFGDFSASICIGSDTEISPSDVFSYGGMVSEEIKWDTNKDGGPYESVVNTNYEYVPSSFPAQGNLYARVTEGTPDTAIYVKSNYGSGSGRIYYSPLKKSDSGFWYEAMENRYLDSPQSSYYNDDGMHLAGYSAEFTPISPATVSGNDLVDADGNIEAFLHIPTDSGSQVYTKKGSNDDYVVCYAGDIRNPWINGLTSPVIDDDFTFSKRFFAKYKEKGGVKYISDFEPWDDDIESMDYDPQQAALQKQGWSPKTEMVDAPYTYYCESENKTLTFSPKKDATPAPAQQETKDGAQSKDQQAKTDTTKKETTGGLAEGSVKIAKAEYKGSNITTAEIPETVKEVGESAFENCKDLVKVKFKGNKVKVIKKNAFKNCPKLKSAVLPDSVTEIQANAFKGDKKLGSITLGPNVKTIKKGAFSGIKKNAKITIRAKNKTAYNKIVKKVKKSGAKNVKFKFKKIKSKK